MSIQEVEMCKQRGRGRAGLECKTTFATGGFDEPVDSLAGEVGRRCSGAGRGVERRNTQEVVTFEVIHDAGVHFGVEGRSIGDAASDQVGS